MVESGSSMIKDEIIRRRILYEIVGFFLFLLECPGVCWSTLHSITLLQCSVSEGKMVVHS